MLSNYFKLDAFNEISANRLLDLAGSLNSKDTIPKKLYAQIVANYLRSKGCLRSVFVFVPCTSYEEILTINSVFQILAIRDLRVFIILSLPNNKYIQIAMLMAAKDNLSQLLYFFNASLFSETYSKILSGYGSILLLKSDILSEPELTAINDIVKLKDYAFSCRNVISMPSFIIWRNTELIKIESLIDNSDKKLGFKGIGEAAGYIAQRDIPNFNKFTDSTKTNGSNLSTGTIMRSILDDGRVVSINHPLLDRLMPFERPKPALALKKQGYIEVVKTINQDLVHLDYRLVSPDSY